MKALPLIVTSYPDSVPCSRAVEYEKVTVHPQRAPASPECRSRPPKPGRHGPERAPLPSATSRQVAPTVRHRRSIAHPERGLECSGPEAISHRRAARQRLGCTFVAQQVRAPAGPRIERPSTRWRSDPSPLLLECSIVAAGDDARGCRRADSPTGRFCRSLAGSARRSGEMTGHRRGGVGAPDLFDEARRRPRGACGQSSRPCGY